MEYLPLLLLVFLGIDMHSRILSQHCSSLHTPDLGESKLSWGPYSTPDLESILWTMRSG